jgi:hypothetical protein
VDHLIELAAEVKVPISDCYIPLGVPAGFFKQDSSRTQALAEVRANLQGQRANLQGSQQFLTAMQTMPAAALPPQFRGMPPDAVKHMLLDPIQAQIVGLQAEEARLATPLHPQLFLVETYRLTTLRTAEGKGPKVSSLNLMPGEKKTFTITTSFAESTDITKTTTVMESEDSTVSHALSDHVAHASTDNQSKDSSEYGLNANFHGDASVGFGSGEVNAALDVKGHSNSVRSDFSNAVSGAVDQQVGDTSASRRQSVSEGTSKVDVQHKTDTVSTDEITNPNPTHALTVFWFQLLEEYTSFLALVSVDVAFRTTDRSLDRQVPLHGLGELLNEVLNVSEVDHIREVVKGELDVVLDYQDQVRSIAEEVPLGPTNTLLRVKPNLQTTYVQKDGSGAPLRNINVDGVLVKVMTHVIPSRLLVTDLVVGEVSAISSVA